MRGPTHGDGYFRSFTKVSNRRRRNERVECHLSLLETASLVEAPLGLVQSSRVWARRIKRDAITLWFARSHPRTPWYAKALGLFVVAYALSPIDLIPDFIPVLGYLDDVVLLPALIWWTVRMLPPDVLAQCRQRAEDWMIWDGKKPRSLAGAALIVAVWTAVCVVVWLWLSQ